MREIALFRPTCAPRVTSILSVVRAFQRSRRGDTMRLTHRFSRFQCVVVVAGVLVSLSASRSGSALTPANAKSAKPKKSGASDIPAVTLSPGLKEKLKGNDAASVQNGLEELRIAGHARASFARYPPEILDLRTTPQLS